MSEEVDDIFFCPIGTGAERVVRSSCSGLGLDFFRAPRSASSCFLTVLVLYNLAVTLSAMGDVRNFGGVFDLIEATTKDA